MTDTLAQAIAVNLRALRTQRGLSQRALARSAGVSSPAVNGWEDADSPVSISAAHLVAVAGVLGVSVTTLLGQGAASEPFRDGYAAGWAACRKRMNDAAAMDTDGGAP